MRVDISKLKDGDRISLEHEYDPEELNIQVQDLRYQDLLKLKGTLERVKDSLFFRGFLTSRIEFVCVRCLKAEIIGVNEPFDLFYTHKGEDYLETTGEIREVMLLSYPVKYLCSENCRGLCPHCGTNLNEASCSCQSPEERQSSFVGLKEWLSKKKRKF